MRSATFGDRRSGSLSQGINKGAILRGLGASVTTESSEGASSGEIKMRGIARANDPCSLSAKTLRVCEKTASKKRRALENAPGTHSKCLKSARSAVSRPCRGSE